MRCHVYLNPCEIYMNFSILSKQMKTLTRHRILISLHFLLMHHLGSLGTYGLTNNAMKIKDPHDAMKIKDPHVLKIVLQY